MSANAANADTNERNGTQRIDMTMVRAGRVTGFAETELGDDAIGFERRGGWTYLITKRTR